MIQFQHAFRMALDRCTTEEIILTGRNNYTGIVLRATLTGLAITAGFIFLAIWSGGFPLVSLLSILGTVTALSAWFSMLGSLRSRTYGKERIEFRKQVIRYTHHARDGRYTSLPLEGNASCRLLIDGQVLRFFLGDESTPRFEFSIDQGQHGEIGPLALRILDVIGLSPLREATHPSGKLIVAGKRETAEVPPGTLPQPAAADVLPVWPRSPFLVLTETAEKVIIRGNSRLKVGSNEFVLHKAKQYVYVKPKGLIGKPFDIRTITSFRYSVWVSEQRGLRSVCGSLLFETARGKLIEALTYTCAIEDRTAEALILDDARENLKYMIRELTVRVKELQLAAIARKQRSTGAERPGGE